MGKKYYYPKRRHGSSGKVALLSALIGAFSQRRHGSHRFHAPYGSYRPGLKQGIVSYVLKKLLRKVF